MFIKILILIWEIFCVFGAMTITELLWAFYIHNLRDNREHYAGIYSALIILFGGVTTILFINNHWMLIPAALGAYFGTWISKFFYKKK